jgi:hypothetical protein
VQLLTEIELVLPQSEPHRWQEVSDLSPEQPFHEIFAGQGKVLGDVAEKNARRHPERPGDDGS